MNLPRLVTSCALFAALPAAMTFVDAPLPRSEFYVQAAGDPQITSSISGSERMQEPGEC
jgi:hypothetical protein